MADKTSTDLQQLFTRTGAADFLAVSKQTVDKLTKTGALPAVRLAGIRAIRFRRSDLLALQHDWTASEPARNHLQKKTPSNGPSRRVQ